MKDDLKTKLDFLEKKQNELINDIITFRDQYVDEPEISLLIQNLRNASDQVLKLRLRLAGGELLKKEDKNGEEGK